MCRHPNTYRSNRSPKQPHLPPSSSLLLSSAPAAAAAPNAEAPAASSCRSSLSSPQPPAAASSPPSALLLSSASRPFFLSSLTVGQPSVAPHRLAVVAPYRLVAAALSLGRLFRRRPPLFLSSLPPPPAIPAISLPSLTACTKSRRRSPVAPAFCSQPLPPATATTALVSSKKIAATTLVGRCLVAAVASSRVLLIFFPLPQPHLLQPSSLAVAVASSRALLIFFPLPQPQPPLSQPCPIVASSHSHPSPDPAACRTLLPLLPLPQL
ncbi:hypothetical protein BHE74_00003597 [Ensete ventricosum]|nr:hypothetical protein BHE74_00003597 [Ensete ventricosum]